MRGAAFRIDDRAISLSTHDLHSNSAHELDDERDAALMRAVAFAPPRPPPRSVTPGTRWSASGRYVIERRLGRGGMGTVYAATDTVLNRIVALKLLDVAGADHDVAHHARLLREAQLAASMEHERIARVYDVGSHEGFAFVAMEYVPGGTLRQWMARGDVPLTQIIDIVTQIAEGLAELHAKGVVHRDLKPENVMMTAQGGVKLVDFGLARHAALHADEPDPPVRDGRARIAHSSSTAAASGTPGYMAPEQCSGQAMDERVDIFALGVILYELVAQEKPFRGATVGAIVSATLEATPIFHEAVWARAPALLRAHAAKMLEREPGARFADGSGALVALRELTTGMSSERIHRPVELSEALSGAPTQRALRLRLPVLVDVGLATRGLELPAAGIALACLGVLWLHPRPLPSAPAGMALIDVGTIVVGHNADALERDCHELGAGCDRAQLYREAPLTELDVPAFFLDKTEVTNDEFAVLLNTFAGLLTVAEDADSHVPRFVGRNAGTGHGAGQDEVLFDLDDVNGGVEAAPGGAYRVRAGRGALPAAQASWYGAKLYCEAQGKRLPTEDEWEAAARGHEDRRFPWGDALPRCGQVVIPGDGEAPMAAGCAASVAAQPVGSAPQDVTPEGVHDLGGNVAEWTSSRFVEHNRAARRAEGPREMPRVIRGGSWGESLMVRTSGRSKRPPSVMGANLGFRCALSVEDARP
ncbi:MAG: bifunctional serine/threonine-protein kinase/formylglycine-generating enzyme family protein [Kofleriaceae bacterium]